MCRITTGSRRGGRAVATARNGQHALRAFLILFNDFENRFGFGKIEAQLKTVFIRF